MSDEEEKKDVDSKNSDSIKPKFKLENILLIAVCILIIGCMAYTYYMNNRSVNTFENFDEYINDFDYDDDYYYDEEDDDYYDEDEEWYDLEDDEYYYDGNDSISDDNEYYEDEEDNYDNYDDIDYEEIQEKFASQEKNISITGTLDVNKYLVAKIDNKNSEEVTNFYIYAVFYDGSNKIIGIDYDYVDIIESNVSAYITFANTPSDVEKYDFYLEKDVYSDEEEYIPQEEISYEVAENNDSINIKVTNNSDSKIDYADFSVIYYDENHNILSVDDLITDYVKVGKSTKLYSYGPYNEKYNKEIEYSSYEVIFNYAISYSY